jgi:peptidoglycan/LPS O-acetylase OafA/YrhL
MVLTGSPFYKGETTGLYHSGPGPDASQHSIASFLGNVAFMQTVSVPTFGSNGPLWSLANEFWYYVLFPVWFCAFIRTETNARLGHAVIGLIISWALPVGLLLYGPIWLFGVAASALSDKVKFSRRCRRLFVVLSGTGLAVALTLSRTSELHGVLSDFLIGASFATMLVPISQVHRANPILAKLSRAGAEFSYTLYLMHFPIAAFLACYVLGNRRLMPNLESVMVYIGFLFIILLYSYATYLLFERNTLAVRHAISQLAAQLRADEASKPAADPFYASPQESPKDDFAG